MNGKFFILQFLGQVIELDIFLVFEHLVVIDGVDLFVVQLELLGQSLQRYVPRQVLQDHQFAILDEMPKSVYC